MTAPGNPLGIAADAGHVYWANGGLPYNTNAISRADLDGTDIDQGFVGAGPDSLPLGWRCGQRKHLYWTDFGRIGRADLDGANQFFGGFDGANTALAADAGHVYWTTSATIARADLDTTNADQSFITGASNPYGIAVDAGHVYWANGGTNTIARANLDGTGVDPSFIAGAANPQGVAVDDLPRPPETTPPDTTRPRPRSPRALRTRPTRPRSSSGSAPRSPTRPSSASSTRSASRPAPRRRRSSTSTRASTSSRSGRSTPRATSIRLQQRTSSRSWAEPGSGPAHTGLAGRPGSTACEEKRHLAGTRSAA